MHSFKPASKENLAIFRKAVKDYLQSTTAVPYDASCLDREDFILLETRYGSLQISGFCPDSYSIFCRFKEPKRVTDQYLLCNPRSGKWNPYYSGVEDPRRAAQLIINDLKKFTL